jgi:ABC-type cobalamin/Fe3+-siderophores transport system ATPase subunit
MDECVVLFEAVSFSYPKITDDEDTGSVGLEPGEGDNGPAVFDEIDLEIPAGVVSFVGQNGSGKSTALLLSSGRLQPDSGKVELFGVDSISLTDEEERNRYASFIYQNMEFETEETVAELFSFVYENGFIEESSRDEEFIPNLVAVFELKDTLGRKLQDLSKGEMQRAILVFSLLYGSRSIMMDEPIFALEEYQKKGALEYLVDFARRKNTPLYFSLHELDLSRSFADYAVLFYTDGRNPLVGSVDEVLTRELIENAYQYPAAMLHQREHLWRERLMKLP